MITLSKIKRAIKELNFFSRINFADVNEKRQMIGLDPLTKTDVWPKIETNYYPSENVAMMTKETVTKYKDRTNIEIEEVFADMAFGFNQPPPTPYIDTEGELVTDRSFENDLENALLESRTFDPSPFALPAHTHSHTGADHANHSHQGSLVYGTGANPPQGIIRDLIEKEEKPKIHPSKLLRKIVL